MVHTVPPRGVLQLEGQRCRAAPKCRMRLQKLHQGSLIGPIFTVSIFRESVGLGRYRGTVRIRTSCPTSVIDHDKLVLAYGRARVVLDIKVQNLTKKVL